MLIGLDGRWGLQVVCVGQKDTCQYWGSKRVSHPDGLNAPSVAVLWDERQVPALVLESRSES